MPKQDGFTNAEIAEQHLGTCGDEASHCAGDRLESSVTILNQETFEAIDADGKNQKLMRRIKVQRSLKGLTINHYTFDLSLQAQLPMLSAIGRSKIFGYHKTHRRGTLSLWDMTKESKETVLSSSASVGAYNFNCICLDALLSNGQLCNHDGAMCANPYDKSAAPPCDDEPNTFDVGAKTDCGNLQTQKNPTLKPRTYLGGLLCCAPGIDGQRILLDTDQPDNPAEKDLRYHMKLRFWFQEYSEKVAEVDDAKVVDTLSTSSSKKKIV